MSKPTPALETAVAFLWGCVERHAARGCTRLPSTQSLADEAGVGLVTMCRAVKRLQREDVLQARPGRGIHIAASNMDQTVHSESDHPLPLPPRPTRDSVAAGIQTRISQGVWTDRLPSQKELANLYDTTAATVRHALAILCQRGLLSAHRRSYFLRRRPHGVPPAILSLVVNAAVRSDIPGRRRAVVEIIERLCRDHAYKVHRASFRDISTDAMRGLIRDHAAEFSRSQGIIYISAGFKVPPSIYLAKALAEFGAPFFLYSDTDPSPGAMRFVHSNMRTILCTQPYSTQLPGKDMGRYLATLGHRTVAYLCDHHGNPWSRNRHAGLVAALSRATPGSCIVPVVFDAPANAIPNEPIPPYANPAAPFTARQQRLHAISALTWKHREAQLRPLFEQAIALNGPTAWVCGNDQIAVLAVDFLRQRGVHVPRDISVVGFDDMSEAHTEGITTYRFREQELAQALFAHVINSTLFHTTKRKGSVISIGGFVVERGTSGASRPEVSNQ